MTAGIHATGALPEAWSRYHDAVELARNSMAATGRFERSEDHRVRAYYCLSEVQAMAYNFAVAPKPAYPIVQSHTSWMTYFYTLGGNCADFYYGALFLDGREEYRITGRFGDLELILVQVFDHPMGHPLARSIGNYDLADLQIEADGSFELVAGPAEREGNWVRLDPGSDRNFLFIRRSIPDAHLDKGTLEVAPLGRPAESEQLTAGQLASRLEMATHYLTYTIEKLCVGYYDMCLDRAGGLKNVAAPMPGTEIDTELAGSPSSDYANAVFDIEPGQALIVEVDVPEESAFWSVQLYDVWLKPLDFVHHQTHLNMHRMHVDADGKARAIVCQVDPGVPNWLDTAGVDEGLVVFRNYRARSRLEPALRVVDLAELRDHLPVDTPVVTPDQRALDLDHRRDGFDRMYG
jgi:hypothetical protein